jgi:hypothetical protein
MEHLTAEALARLVDEAPTHEERNHLDSCLSCQGELGALKAQTEALGALPDLRPPRGDWEELEARLISEGLVRGDDGSGRSILPSGVGWMQVAAGLVLLLGGAAIGSSLTRSAGHPSNAVSADLGRTPELVALPAMQVGNVEDAEEAVRIAEQNYVDALIQYRQMAQSSGRFTLMDDPASRYAALDALVRAGQAAVRQVPADPFLNGFLASAVAEQEAVLRRISNTAEDNWY